MMVQENGEVHDPVFAEHGAEHFDLFRVHADHRRGRDHLTTREVALKDGVQLVVGRLSLPEVTTPRLGLQRLALPCGRGCGWFPTAL